MNERDWRGGWVIVTQMKNNSMCDITKLGKRIEEKLQMMISKIDCQKNRQKREKNTKLVMQDSVLSVENLIVTSKRYFQLLFRLPYSTVGYLNPATFLSSEIDNVGNHKRKKKNPAAVCAIYLLPQDPAFKHDLLFSIKKKQTTAKKGQYLSNQNT